MFTRAPENSGSGAVDARRSTVSFFRNAAQSTRYMQPTTSETHNRLKQQSRQIRFHSILSVSSEGTISRS